MLVDKIMNAPDDIRRVTILGSTGSVGCSTIAVLKASSPNYKIRALTANENVELLAEQALDLCPDFAVIGNKDKYLKLKELLSGSEIRVAGGPDAIVEAAALRTDWTMAAIVGSAGLRPVLTSIGHGGIVAIANKECLVCAGDLLVAAAGKSGARLLPVDSEHNGIFQIFDFDNPEAVDKIFLTASGGPFLRCARSALENVTPEQAVRHPNWKMGPKISVDSATMMNKALEIIEAFHLFPVSVDQISVLIHPESIVHSLISYCDGSILAQLGNPDMRVPIAYTLSWPQRFPTSVPKLDMVEVGSLTFLKPSQEQFPALRVVNDVLLQGASSAIIMNAANEIAVNCFLQKKISFLAILEIVEATLAGIQYNKAETIEQITSVDQEARNFARNLIENL
jgi:1-deoxy-D-xylulose-5-phosphate reductoisomerase